MGTKKVVQIIVILYYCSKDALLSKIERKIRFTWDYIILRAFMVRINNLSLFYIEDIYIETSVFIFFMIIFNSVISLMKRPTI